MVTNPQSPITDFGRSTLATSITPTDTSLRVTAGEGALFQSTGRFKALIWSSQYASPLEDPDRELVMVRNVSGDTFDMRRGMDGTIPRDWPAGSHVAHIYNFIGKSSWSS